MLRLDIISFDHLLGEMGRTWTSYIYGFFNKEAAFNTENGRPYVEFTCLAKICRAKGGRGVRRFLDTKDRGSTGNMKRHAERCFGIETVKKGAGSDIDGVRKGLALKKDGSIVAAFDPKGKGVVTYSLTPLTNAEIR